MSNLPRTVRTTTHVLASAITLALTASCSGPCGHAATRPAKTSAATATGASTPSDPQTSESARLRAWLDRAYETTLQFSPMMMTFLGRRDRYGELDDLSFEAQDRELDFRAQSVADMEQRFDFAALDEEAQTSYTFWKYLYERDRAAAAFRHSVYTFEHLNGFQNLLPTFLINFHRVESRADMEAYVSRLRASGRAFDQLLAQAEAGAQRGTHIPAFALQGVIEQSEAVLRGAPFAGDADAPLWADIKTKVGQLQSAGTIDGPAAEALQAQGKTALLEAVKPAYGRLIVWARGELAHAPKVNTGVHTLPDGAAFYRHMLWEETTTTLGAEEIHALGLREVERLRGEMSDLKDQIGFDGDLQAFFKHVREMPTNHYPNTDEGRSAYLQQTTAVLENIKQQIPRYFGILPKADVVVRRVERFRERDGAPQHYYPGTPDGTRPGIVYAHLSNMSAMPKNQLEVIAYHEGIPGHHLQLSIAQELPSIPQFRAHADVTAYSEGWALYAERLAKEMEGTYRDPYADFGRLTTEIWRAARLVVDTGLHHKGWTEEQAVQFMLDYTPEPETSVRAEVQRYLVWPGQATSYKIGMLKIQELRAEAERALGPRFKLSAFHDTVLSGGALPLDLLAARVRSWCERQQP